MDQDQDLLDQIDRREHDRVVPVFWLLALLSALVAIVMYGTLRLQLHAGAEVARDVAGIAAALTFLVVLVVRKILKV